MLANKRWTCSDRRIHIASRRERLGAVVLVALVSVGCAGANSTPAPVVVMLAQSPSASVVETPEAPPAGRATPLGHWSGRGAQSDGSTWPMDVDITQSEAGACATVSYPSLDCGGRWECQPGSSPTELLVLEHITYGLDGCIDGGAVEAKLSNDGEVLLWSWRDQAAEITANARLRRPAAGSRRVPEAPR
jgi:hypothetical protein